MGCTGSRPNFRSSLDQQYTNSSQPGFITFDTQTVEFIKANELDIKTKLKHRCEQKLLKKRLQSSSFKTSLINNAKRRSQAIDTDLDSKITTRSNQSLNKTNALEIKTQMIDLAVDHVLKYAVNDFKLDTHLSLEQLRQDIIRHNSSISPDYSMHSIGSANIVDSNNNNVETDNRFYKKALNVAVDELDLFLRESSIIISEFEIHKQEVNIDLSGEPVMKLKDALDIARHMFYEGKYSTIYSTKAGGYVVREANGNQVTTDLNSVNQPRDVTSFVSEAKQLKEKYLQQQTPVTIIH